MQQGSPIRILALLAYPQIDGPLPKLSPLLVQGLRDLGCAVQVTHWSRHTENESLVQKLVGRAGDVLAVRAALREAERQGRPMDIMYVQTTHDEAALTRDIPLLLVTRRLGRRRVLHFHGSMCDQLEEPGREVFKAVSRWEVKHAGAVLLLSDEERQRWRSFCDGARFETVLNPFVPSAQALAAPARVPLVDRPLELLFVGRIIPAKGVFDLVEAVAVVHARRACHVTVAGAGSYQGALRERVHALGLDEVVDLRGYVEHASLSHLYAEADALVLPTYFGEGFPTVISEAMSYGLPVITTRTRGAADLLEDGMTVLFVPAHDPEVLAAAIDRLAADEALRSSMGQRGRAKVREFAPKAVLGRYIDVFRSLCAEGEGASAEHPVGRARILDVEVDAVSSFRATAQVLKLAAQVRGEGDAALQGAVQGGTSGGAGAYVCAANVHVVMEAHDDREFLDVVRGADLVVADGRPVVWAARLLGKRDAQQTRGQDLMLSVCSAAARAGRKVGLYGSDERTLKRAVAELQRQAPDLDVAYAYSPPFRPLSAVEETAVVRAVAEAGVEILFVGLGCPKQERWMAQHRESVRCVMLGVGAAFDMVAGTDRKSVV